MTFAQRRPSPPLEPFVASFWVCRNARRPIAFERVVPTGGPQLIVNLCEDETRVYENTARGLYCHSSPGSVLTGITTRAQIIETAGQEFVAGIAFRPGGTVPFFAVPAFEVSDRQTPVAAFWGARAEVCLREQLLEAANTNEILDALEASLLAAWRDRAVHPAVTFAIEVFESQPQVARIDSVADAAGLSAKRFIERFKAEVGVTPKRFCRLLRFQRAVKQAHRAVPVDWTRLALDCGYFDQAHFIHEFRQFSGLTPREYRAAATPFANHVNFVQSFEREAA